MAGDEQDQKFFTLNAAERARRELEPTLVEAVELNAKLTKLDDALGEVSQRILLMGGVTIPHEKLALVRAERDRVVVALRDAVEKIQSVGCLVKDLEKGLVDFPARMNNQDVYLCWRLGEARIRFWHRKDEGFASRKPIDPNDAGPQDPVQ
ncbi:MAG TPA: DUF2203 domain-containing protein [Methylomirabilota bacterium]|jgi:hypothetical protein|nr:DUF2203 domain-containing protein [Methylomirabilota bacterium]